MLSPPRERPIAWSSPAFFGACAVLMGPHDGAVDHGVFVVRVGCQKFEHRAPHAALGPSAKARVNRLPIAEALRQVAPWNAGAIAVDHGVDKQPIVLGGHPDMTVTSGQKILDPIPLVVAKRVTAHLSAPRQPTARNHAPRPLGSSVRQKSGRNVDNARSIRRAQSPDSNIAPISSPN